MGAAAGLVLPVPVQVRRARAPFAMNQPANPGGAPDEEPDCAVTSDPRLLQAILGGSGLLVVVLDDQGRIVFFNRACEELTGYTAVEVVGRTVWDLLIRPEDRDAVRDVHHALLSQTWSNLHENHWLTRAGQPRFIAWRNLRLPRSANAPPLVIGTGIDITDRIRVTGELHETAARLRAILETSVLGIITIDETGIIESFNPAAERLFGFSAAEVVGRNVNVLMPEPDRSAHDRYLQRYRDTGEARIIGIGREVRGRRKDGTTFPFELSVSEVRLAERRLFTGFIHDISDRRVAEQTARRRLDELAHASRLSTVGEMSSGIAHEINQPLTAVVTFADACLRMLRSGRIDPALLETALTQVAEQGERASEIVRRLRVFVRKDEANHGPVDLNAAVLDVLGLLEHDLAVNDVDPRLELAPDLPPVLGDRIQVEQVVLNLVRNAVEATAGVRSGPQVAISTRRVDDGIVLSVDDNGRGVEPEDQDRVFAAFYTTKPSGMGMGLSVSRSILAACGGTIACEDGHLGGARFVCRFTACGEEEVGS
jgi:two-component system, LuxR family, sensor kinase FixL